MNKVNNKDTKAIFRDVFRTNAKNSRMADFASVVNSF